MTPTPPRKKPPISEVEFYKLISGLEAYLDKERIREARIYWTGIMEYQI